MRRLLFILFFSSFFISSCGQEGKLPEVVDENDLSVLDNYTNGLEEKGVYGSFLVIEKDVVIFKKSIGFSNREKKIKANKNTIYPYGSITKEYTSSVVFQLIIEGMLKETDDLTQFFDGVPNDKKAITIEQLLKHRSGLQEYHGLNLSHKYPNVPADFYPITKNEALERILSQELKYAPGTSQNYSNSGYTLLALIIEKVTGKSFEDVIYNYILKPANTKHADFYSSKLWQPNQVAIGYNNQTYGKENSAYYWPRHTMTLFGNGGMAGSLDDLYKGLRFMIKNQDENPKYGDLGKAFRYLENLPEEYITYGGGDDLGFVAGYFVEKQKDKYFLFALNNNIGNDHAYMLRDIILLLFDFDFARLAPDVFEQSDYSKNEEKHLTKNDLKGKWRLPPGNKFQKIGIFLDLITASDRSTIDAFINEQCTHSYAKKAKKASIEWPFSETIDYKKISESGNTLKVTLVDSKTKKSYLFIFSFDKNNRFKNIKFNEF